MIDSLRDPKKADGWKNGHRAINWGNVIHLDKKQNALLAQVLRRVAVRADRILDLGSGNGRVVPMIPVHSEYVGVDFSPLVDQSVRDYASLKPRRIFLKHDLANGIPESAGESYDLILAIFLLHFFTPSGMKMILEEATKILAERGEIFFMTYAEDASTERNTVNILEELGLEVVGVGELDDSRYVGHIGRKR